MEELYRNLDRHRLVSGIRNEVKRPEKNLENNSIFSVCKLHPNLLIKANFNSDFNVLVSKGIPWLD